MRYLLTKENILCATREHFLWVECKINKKAFGREISSPHNSFLIEEKLKVGTSHNTFDACFMWLGSC